MELQTSNTSLPGTPTIKSPAPWYNRRKIGSDKVSRSISGRAAANMEHGWYFARQIGMPLNRFVTIRPHNIDDFDPVHRKELWNYYRNKLIQVARDAGFETAYIWCRESTPGAGTREHFHFVFHVPKAHAARFSSTVRGWFCHQEECDIRPASYNVHTTRHGKLGSMIGYITKNSPQRGYSRNRQVRPGGPILGKRAGCSTNISKPARDRWYLANPAPRDDRSPTPSCTSLMGEFRIYAAETESFN